MHDHALRLIDNGKVVVLVDDLNRNILGQRRGLAHGRKRDADFVPGGDAGILRGGRSVHRDCALGKQAGSRRAGHIKIETDKDIGAAARVLRRRYAHKAHRAVSFFSFLYESRQ